MRLLLRTHRTGFDAVHVGRPVRFFAGRLIIFSVCSLLLAAFMFAAPAASSAYVAVSVTIAPPAIPIYVQPACPGPGYMWTPGYWAWDPAYGYYWVPGTWVLAPFQGALWTPGYWGWTNGVYIWHGGYWGPVVGFYGGINYGFGYTGYGYWGGYWRGRAFYYNRAVTNINARRITTVYDRRVTRYNARRTGYNGGPGGIRLRPTAAQLAAERQRRFAPIAIQRQHELKARSNPRLRAAVNHGRPAIAATSRPGVFTGRGVVRASRAGAQYRAAPRTRAVRPNTRARTPNTGRYERRQRTGVPGGGAPGGTIMRRQGSSGRPAGRGASPRGGGGRRLPSGGNHKRGGDRSRQQRGR